MHLQTGLKWTLVVLVLSGCEGKKEGEEAQNGGGASTASTPAPTSEAEVAAGSGGAAAPADSTAAAAATGKTTAEPAAVPDGNGVSVAEKRRQKVADALKAVYCAQRKDTGVDILPLYASHGFPTPADWVKAWEADAEKKPEWAHETIAALTPTACVSK